MVSKKIMTSNTVFCRKCRIRANRDIRPIFLIGSIRKRPTNCFWCGRSLKKISSRYYIKVTEDYLELINDNLYESVNIDDEDIII